MAFKMEIEMNLRMDYFMVDDDYSEFCLHIEFEPHLFYRKQSYSHVSIFIDDKEEYKDWKYNYMNKIEDLYLANYSEDWGMDHSSISIRDIKDEELKNNLIKEITKILLKESI